MIQYYSELKADQITIKSKIYKWKNEEVQYDNDTGRLIKMKYKEQ